jgi:hypothetical protein
VGGLRRKLALCGAIAVAAGLAALVAPPARAAEVGVVSDLNWGISATDQERTVGLMRDLGARWARLHVSWRDFEQLKGVYNDWNLIATGAAIDQARAAGAQVIVMVHEAPSWASGSSSSNVARNPADYADFIRFLAGHYRGKVAAYEIWNEQNYARFWSTGPSATAYAALLKAAYPAVKAGDPEARVVYGGLSRNDYFFVDETYRAGVKGSFDALAVHPYPDCGRSPDWLETYADGRIRRGAFLGYREVRATMAAYGDLKPIWFTEFGWTTATSVCDPSKGSYFGGVSETTQAAYLTRALELAAQDTYVEVALIYNFRNNFWAGDADDAEARFGLLRTDFTPKPSFFAVQQAAGGSAPPVDSPTPALSVSLLKPLEGERFKHRLDFSATAQGAQRVEFLVDGRVVGQDASAPYALSYDARHLTRGSHRAEARAVAADGLTSTVGVTVTRR